MQSELWCRNIKSFVAQKCAKQNGFKQPLDVFATKHGQNGLQSRKEKRIKSLIDIISAIRSFQSYWETNLMNAFWMKTYYFIVTYWPSSELLLGQSTISRQNLMTTNDCGVKIKLLGLNKHVALFKPHRHLNFSIPNVHYHTSKLHTCSKEGNNVEKKSFCFVPLLNTILPVWCYSEKINICWKVQIDDKEPSFSYCISCNVRHGLTHNTWKE